MAALSRFSLLVLTAIVGLALAAGAAAAPSTGLLKIGGPFPAGVDAGNYQYVVLHSDRAALIPALKAANPQLKVLVYKDMAAALSWAGTTKLPAGVSMAEAEANPEWFLNDTNGRRIEWCDYAGDWQMDVGRRSYQDRWATNVGADMRANGWDGVFVDDTNASQSWHLCGRTIAKYPTDAAYASATRSFLANVGPALTSQGFLVIPNIYLPYSSNALATWLDWISFTSGGMQEFWSKWGTGATEHFAGNDWTYRQQFLGATQRAGKIFLGLTYAPSSDVRSMRYARSTFLLDWDGGESALLLESGNGVDPTDADWMTDIGSPRGARYPAGAAWRRDYSGGTVLVNPSAATVWINLEAPHVNQDGQVVSSLALAPTTGAVLRRLGAAAPVSPPPAPVVMSDFRLKVVKQGRTGADLYWSGVRAGTAVDVFRNGLKIAPLAGERSFTYSSYPDRFGRTGRGKVTWQVCRTGTASCSNTASLSY
ncbi:MAG TPA: putative glycoside hydrolase [Gaiellaceae bacterium]|nr:putative glycoside hydrolase [Gaiellaceae bacterium]